MTPERAPLCPECGTELDRGFFSYGSGVLWHQQQLRGWQRVFPFAFASGRRILGSWTSTGLMRSRPALLCESCGTVVLPHTKVSTPR